jgi:hypothetical protein
MFFSLHQLTVSPKQEFARLENRQRGRKGEYPEYEGNIIFMPTTSAETTEKPRLLNFIEPIGEEHTDFLASSRFTPNILFPLYTQKQWTC